MQLPTNNIQLLLQALSMLSQQNPDENESKDNNFQGTFTHGSGMNALVSLAGANDMTPIFGQNYSDITNGAVQKRNVKAPNFNSNQFNLSQYSEDAIV